MGNCTKTISRLTKRAHWIIVLYKKKSCILIGLSIHTILNASLSFSQRIYISDRRDSTSHRLTKMWLTQPLPASVRQSGAVPSIIDIYSLVLAYSFLIYATSRFTSPPPVTQFWHASSKNAKLVRRSSIMISCIFININMFKLYWKKLLCSMFNFHIVLSIRSNFIFGSYNKLASFKLSKTMSRDFLTLKRNLYLGPFW